MNENNINNTEKVVDQNEGASSSPLPPGSNLICNNDNDADTRRLRREWDHLDNYDRALYLDAVETSIERGLHQRFAVFHFDELSDIQAHETCGFYLWHRMFILAYENMLRSLEPRFACLTLPFWDIYRDYEKQESSANINTCRSYATCAKIINDLGGVVENDDFEERTFFGRKVDGQWHFKPPLQNLRDDNNRVGVIRYDLWLDPIPEEASILSTENITTVLFGSMDNNNNNNNNNNNRIEFWKMLHHGIHDSVHDTIGGFMRTPASPIDPLFMPWHSTMELFDYIWEACHYTNNDMDNVTTNSIGANNDNNNNNDEGEKCTYTPKARNHFPNISLHEDEVYMKLDNAADIRDDPLIGKYFSSLAMTNFADLWNVRDLNEHHQFRYTDIPKNFIRALANNTQVCPNGLSSILEEDIDESDYDYDYDKNSASTVRRQPPTFSNAQLTTFKQDWIEQAQAYYDTAANVSSFSQQQQQQQIDNIMEFLQCLLFDAMDYDTLERWAIDQDTFLTQVVENKRYNQHPLCSKHLFVTTHKTSIDLSSNTTSTTVISSGGTQQGARHSYWIAVVLLVCLVSKLTR